jgi:NAD(P)-dependent dehydrogenase (short-subunit alcohol dehydrogenase family)
MDLGLKGKVALVTGAGSQIGFGKGIALTLAKEGCNVVVADIDLEGAKQTAAEIESSGHRALAMKIDVTKKSEVDEMAKAAVKTFGTIDILVNNAGALSSLKTFIDKPESEWDRDIDINLKGTLNCTKAVLGQMISQKSGKIISISSIGVRKGMAHATVYGASKAGIVGFTQGLAVEVGPLGINVNSIAPGLGVTNFGGGAPPPGLLEQAIARIPVRRTTKPQDIANTVCFLASDVSSDIAGQNISVDGGESII